MKTFISIFKKINLEHFYLFLADILFEIYYKTWYSWLMCQFQLKLFIF